MYKNTWEDYSPFPDSLNEKFRERKCSFISFSHLNIMHIHAIWNTHPPVWATWQDPISKNKKIKSKYFQLYRQYCLCHNYSTLLLEHESSHRLLSCINKWAWLCFKKMLCTKTGRCPLATVCWPLLEISPQVTGNYRAQRKMLNATMKIHHPNPVCGKFYKTNDLFSSTDKWYKSKERGRTAIY